MASKFRDVVGYSLESAEISPGNFEDVIIERMYRGDVGRTGVRARLGENILPDIDITNEFSILADGYAYENFDAMRYIRWAGTYWTIRQIEVVRPRLILRVGGVYHGPTFETPDDSGTDNDDY